MIALHYLFALGVLCGATGLVIVYSLVIGRAYRATGLWWLAAALLVGTVPVLAEVHNLTLGTIRSFYWGRPTAWMVLALDCVLLRQVLGSRASQRVAAYGLAGVAVVALLGALVSMFTLVTGLSLLLGPVWLLVTGLALAAAWVRCKPWIYWLVAGQVAIALGWVGLIALEMHDIPATDVRAIAWKTLHLALFGMATYLALIWRSRLQGELNPRLMGLERKDALTGFALPAVFARQLEAAAERARQQGYRNALISLQVSNLEALAQVHGFDNDELALLAASQAISTVLRETDLATRAANDRFVVLVEGLKAGESLGDAASRFVASGLRADPVRGLHLPIKFQCFAVEAGGERAGATATLLDLLAQRQSGPPPSEPGTFIRVLDPLHMTSPAMLLT